MHVIFSLPGAGLLALSLVLFAPAHADTKPHSHGRLALDVAVDATSITISMESPLDNFLGFERAPRTDAERKGVAALVNRLNAAESLFAIDPQSGCTLSKVDLQSAALGLGNNSASSGATAQGHQNKAEGQAHADIDATFVFACTHADQARFIDVKLIGAFKRITAIDVQLATTQGQFKRILTRSASRLGWGK